MTVKKDKIVKFEVTEFLLAAAATEQREPHELKRMNERYHVRNQTNTSSCNAIKKTITN